MVTIVGLLLAALVLVAGPAPASAATDTILVPGVATPWPGRILVSHDEWTLSDDGFRAAPDAARFARNLALWFTDGRPGKFLVYSSSFGLTGKTLEKTMKAAGHSWTVANLKTPLTLQTLQKYDAVFLAGKSTDVGMLTDYVRSGGNVYLAGGTGADEPALWNGFLRPFGLRFNRPDDPVNGNVEIDSSSPIFAGVDALMAIYGTPISVIDPSSSDARILVADDGWGLYAVYDTGAIAVSVQICPEQLQVPGGGQISVSIAGSATLEVRTFDPKSVRVIGVKTSGPVTNYSVSPVVGALLGRTCLGNCAAQVPDLYLDLTVKVDANQLSKALEDSVGRPLRDGETFALTVSGQLKPEFGGAPIVGEDLVVVALKKK